MNPASLFEVVMDWLKTSYGQHSFFVERDLVWTIQKRLTLEIVERALPLRVFNDYPILPGNRRSLCADLALLNDGGAVEVAVEFKYEPSHQRGGIDIWPTKFPVIGWSNVAHDMMRANDFVAQGKTKVAYSLLVDEGGYFRHRPEFQGGEWRTWAVETSPNKAVSVHWYKVQQAAIALNADVYRTTEKAELRSQEMPGQ